MKYRVAFSLSPSASASCNNLQCFWTNSYYNREISRRLYDNGTPKSALRNLILMFFFFVAEEIFSLKGNNFYR